MKLDSFHVLELLRDGDWCEATKLVALHFGRDPTDWNSIIIRSEISIPVLMPDKLDLFYPYQIVLLEPGHFWGWSNTYGWESWDSTSLGYNIVIRTPALLKR